MTTIKKQPGEQYPVAFEYYGKLPFRTSLVSGVVSAAVVGSGADATSTVLQSPTALIVGSQARVGVKGGANGTSYKVTVVVTLSDGSTLEDEFTLQVAEV